MFARHGYFGAERSARRWGQWHDAPVRSFVLTLADRDAGACLGADCRYVLRAETDGARKSRAHGLSIG
jgi:hypothetical protein